jgi:Tol biopolymer transport system component
MNAARRNTEKQGVSLGQRVLVPLWLALFLTLTAWGWAPPASAWLVERVSLTNEGGQTTAPSGSYPDSQYPAMSPDGRFVLFCSQATNLVAGDTNGKIDLFLRDRKMRTTVRVNLGPDGAQVTDQNTYQGSISADGRYVTFSSSSYQLSPDANGKTQVYIRDVQAGTTTLISRGPDNAPANNHSAFNDKPVFSRDGKYILYSSSATNLVTGSASTTNQIYLYDRQTGQASLLTRTSDGTPGNDSSTDPAVSADGRFIAFRSSAKKPDQPHPRQRL